MCEPVRPGAATIVTPLTRVSILEDSPTFTAVVFNHNTMDAVVLPSVLLFVLLCLDCVVAQSAMLPNDTSLLTDLKSQLSANEFRRGLEMLRYLKSANQTNQLPPASNNVIQQKISNDKMILLLLFNNLLLDLIGNLESSVNQKVVADQVESGAIAPVPPALDAAFKAKDQHHQLPSRSRNRSKMHKVKTHWSTAEQSKSTNAYLNRSHRVAVANEWIPGKSTRHFKRISINYF